MSVVSTDLEHVLIERILLRFHQAYLFLARNWEPGDEIYIFGFSRGAYTVCEWR